MLAPRMRQQGASALFLIAFLLTHISFIDGEPTCSTQKFLNDCGYYGIQQPECESNDCCWDPSVPSGSPWCFYRNDGYAYCSNTAARIDCGDYSTNEGQCRNRGCCWDEGGPAGQPWCFFPNSDHTMAQCPPDADRVECGDYGIEQDECEDRGCCWSPLQHGSSEPWCYVMPNTVRADANDDFDTCCPDSIRTDCGFIGITPQQCADNGCCYDPYCSSGEGPWCYHKNCRDPSLNTCAAQNYRIDCGNCQIQENECEDRGCCWSPTDNDDEPWCFFKNEGPNPYDTCCPSYSRVECGYYGISQNECSQRGCCWDELQESSTEPWCYRQNCIDPSLDICSPQDNRIECGYYGINQQECVARDCCWSPLEEGSTDPWCFFKNAEVGECCDADARRIDCGYVGIDQAECESQDCCWSPLEEGSSDPWCFYKNSDDCATLSVEEAPRIETAAEEERVTTLSTEETTVAAPPTTVEETTTTTTEEKPRVEAAASTPATETTETTTTATTTTTTATEQEDIFGQIYESATKTEEEYTAEATAEAQRIAEMKMEIEYVVGLAPMSEMAFEEDELSGGETDEIYDWKNEEKEAACTLCKKKREGYTKSSVEVTNTTVEEIAEEAGLKIKPEEEEEAEVGPEPGESTTLESSSKESGAPLKKSASAGVETDKEKPESEKEESGETETSLTASTKRTKERTETAEGVSEDTEQVAERTTEVRERAPGAETDVKATTKTHMLTRSETMKEAEVKPVVPGCGSLLKVKCGKEGIKEKECIDMGCCWEVDRTGFFPNCFMKEEEQF